jgi:hypothetical protein
VTVGLTNGTTAVLRSNSRFAEIFSRPEKPDAGYVNTSLIRETAKQVAPIPKATVAFALISGSYGYGLAGAGSTMLLP